MATAQVSPDLSPRNQLRTALIEKCWKDPEFKAQVIADPKGMFEKTMGRKLPETFKVIVHEEDANTLHFSLPPAPEQVAELSDEELEKVAGGTEIVSITVLAFTAAMVVGSAAASAAGAAAAEGKSSIPW